MIFVGGALRAAASRLFASAATRGLVSTTRTGTQIINRRGGFGAANRYFNGIQRRGGFSSVSGKVPLPYKGPNFTNRSLVYPLSFRLLEDAMRMLSTMPLGNFIPNCSLPNHPKPTGYMTILSLWCLSHVASPLTYFPGFSVKERERVSMAGQRDPSGHWAGWEPDDRAPDEWKGRPRPGHSRAAE